VVARPRVGDGGDDDGAGLTGDGRWTRHTTSPPRRTIVQKCRYVRVKWVQISEYTVQIRLVPYTNSQTVHKYIMLWIQIIYFNAVICILLP
jgi:hypothetical protein